MPALQVCGRAWSLGSDDFVYRCGLLALVNAFGAVCGALAAQADPPDASDASCRSASEPRAWATSAGLLHLALCTTGALCSVASSRGAPFEPSRRLLVPSAVSAHVALALLLLAATCYGTHLLFRLCEDAGTGWWEVLLVCGWVSSGWVVLTLALSRDAAASHSTADDEGMARYEGYWRARLRCAFCCTSRGGSTDTAAFDSAAEVLAGVFAGLDLVQSDIAVGLMLLRLRQRQALRDAQFAAGVVRDTPTLRVSSEAPARGLPPLDPGVLTSLHDLQTFWPHSRCTYGWVTQVLAHGVCGGLARMVGAGVRRSCACRRMRLSGTRGCWCLRCNACGLAAELPGAEPSDFQVISFENKLHQPSYFVVLDHTRKALVVSVRGTLSPSDVVTDLDGVAVSFPDADSADLAHRGMAKSAHRLHDLLKRGDVLEAALADPRVKEAGGYDVVVVGHSLGAGVGVLLSVLLRPRFGNRLRCLAYSVPGGLMTKGLAERTAAYVTALCVGKDIVPRLSVPSVRRVRSGMLAALTDASVPKYQAQLRAWGGAESAGFFLPDEAGRDEQAAIARELSSTVARHSAVHDRGSRYQGEMVPPARMLHLVRLGRRMLPGCTELGVGCCRLSRPHETIWFPVMVDPEVAMRDIVIAPRSAMDHQPHAVSAALDAAVSRAQSGELARFVHDWPAEQPPPTPCSCSPHLHSAASWESAGRSCGSPDREYGSPRGSPVRKCAGPQGSQDGDPRSSPDWACATPQRSPDRGCATPQGSPDGLHSPDMECVSPQGSPDGLHSPDMECVSPQGSPDGDPQASPDGECATPRGSADRECVSAQGPRGSPDGDPQGSPARRYTSPRGSP
eukprot:TRINITY_DN1275_c0_g1_i1.p1 TRINITY_DN1275_c0_g1~~TRINITY_DN1275_c0_g1_i1.p1  ORF type:complete len:848 (+),score=159.42 TRINITY_DN1275_c0_g1_i1:63-2606(+)